MAERRTQDRSFSRHCRRVSEGPALRELASLQQRLGFLLKYKSYAVKAREPARLFGVPPAARARASASSGTCEHKTELFYFISTCCRAAYVFLCDISEWRQVYDATGFCCVARRDAGRRRTSGLQVSFRGPATSSSIDRLNVVHTVVGCTLCRVRHCVHRHGGSPPRPEPAPARAGGIHQELRGATPARAALARHVTGVTAADPAGWRRTAIPCDRVPGGRRALLNDDGVVMARNVPVRRRRGERDRSGFGARGEPAPRQRLGPPRAG